MALPYTFTNGTTANANEVNSNFNYVYGPWKKVNVYSLSSVNSQDIDISSYHGKIIKIIIDISYTGTNLTLTVDNATASTYDYKYIEDLTDNTKGVGGATAQSSWILLRQQGVTGTKPSYAAEIIFRGDDGNWATISANAAAPAYGQWYRLLSGWCSLGTGYSDTLTLTGTGMTGKVGVYVWNDDN